MQKFHLLDHTGDLGILVFGETRGALFQHAAEALFNIITDPETIQKQASRDISLDANSIEELLVGWLSEFLFLLDTQGLIFKDFDIHFLKGSRINATAYGEAYDPERHPLNIVLKAVTYHQLTIYQQGGIWTARVIFDV